MVKLSAEPADGGVIKISQYSQENTGVGVFFNKVAGLQVLRTPILKTSPNGCLVHIMSLKT